MAELTRLVQMYEAAEEASVDSRAESERARDYYDAKQLTAHEMQTLKNRKQPPVIENLVRPKIDSLCGLERQTRTDPVCLPRTYGDDEAAQVATDALRYVADDQKLDIKRSQVFNYMLTEGYGGVEIIAERTRGGIDPKIVPIAWDRLFFDPHSSAHDFSDANYLGFHNWLEKEDAKKLYKGKEAHEAIDTAFERPTSNYTDTYADKPKWASWADKGRNRVRVTTMYYKQDGTWYRCVFTLHGKLEESKPSPWLDEDGKPECGLIFQSAFVDRENNRYGLVRDLFSLQDEVNKRRSKYLHLINSRQLRVSRGAEADRARLKAEAARPDGMFFFDKDELEVIPTIDMSTGHLQLLQEAKIAINGTGPNAHMQGKEGENQSGRAILAMQQAGMVEMAPLLDALRDFNLRVYRSIWNRIRQFWTEERWIRVTDDEKANQFFPVNTTKAKLFEQKLGQAVESQKVDPQQAQMLMQEAMQRPDMMQPANVLSELDVDITIDEVMNTPTLHAEQFEKLSQAIGSGILGQPPDPRFVKMWIMASTFRDKAKMLEILDEAQQQAGQMGQQQQELAQRGMVAEIAGKESQAALNMAKAQGEQVKTALAVPKAMVDAQSQGLRAA